MKYLFFDIESSDGSYGICEFGFVITDEMFNVLVKKIYLINPKKKFNTEGRPGRPDVKLFYSKEEYENAPSFDDLYENIKFVLEQKDVMIFGHAVDNDINYLRKGCERYKLPYINFDAYDVQRMFSYFSQERTKFASLGSVVEKLVPEEERSKLVEHRSVDDAYLTMLTLKSMVFELEFNVNDLIESSPGCKVISKEFIEKIKAREKDRREHPELYSKSRRGHRNKETQVMWGDFYRKYLSKLDEPESIGKIVTISAKIKDDINVLTNVINKIKDSSLVAFDRINGSDYLIVLDEEDKVRLTEKFQYPYKGKIITYPEFLVMDFSNFK